MPMTLLSNPARQATACGEAKVFVCFSAKLWDVSVRATPVLFAPCGAAAADQRAAC